MTTTTNTKIKSGLARIEAHERFDPPANCRRCPRLSRYIAKSRRTEPDWHNGPVATWVPPDGDKNVRILIVGLAPGLKGANRTGRPFTGDASGDTLASVLLRHGFMKGNWGNNPRDGVELCGLAITNAVRCVPPENRPSGAEINTCRDRFLAPTLSRFEALETIVTLGRIAHDATVRAFGAKPADHPFGHGALSSLHLQNERLINLRASYHCSRYNMNTGRLTPEQFAQVFEGLRE